MTPFPDRDHDIHGPTADGTYMFETHRLSLKLEPSYRQYIRIALLLLGGSPPIQVETADGIMCDIGTATLSLDI